MKVIISLFMVLAAASLGRAAMVGSCPAENGNVTILLPDDESCHIFHICGWGSPIPMICKNDLFFNPANNQCDFPANVMCNHTAIANEPTGSVTNCTATNDTKAEHIPDKTSCNTFYICKHRIPIAMTCPMGFAYDRTTWTCNYKEYVKCETHKPLHDPVTIVKDCESGPTTTNETGPAAECPRGEDVNATHIADKSNSTIYYICINGVPFRMLCPLGLQYDKSLWICNYPEKIQDVTIASSVSNDLKTTERNQSNETVETDWIGECPKKPTNGTAFLLSKNPHKFYICVGRRPVEMDCPAELVFNLPLERCDYYS